MRTVEITMVLDFMCPWSFIALRSLRAARVRFEDRLEFAPVEFLPFEFDPPGTYPPEGKPWVDYCRSFGEPKAKFLLEDKLPRAFALGRELGINFSLDRRIVHTVDVNTGLALAAQHGKGEAFAEAALSRHFENLEDPNNPQALRTSLQSLGIPEATVDAALSDPARAGRNAEATAAGRALLSGGGVPSFVVRCGGSSADLCKSAPGSVTMPGYFEGIFSRCAAAAEEEACEA